MVGKPNFRKWAQHITWRAECGEGFSYNLPYDLTKALEDAYRLGMMDGLYPEININGTVTERYGTKK